MRTNLFKLGSCSSYIYTKDDRIYKEIILSSNEDEAALKKGIDLISNFDPKSILVPLEIEFNHKSIQGKDFISLLDSLEDAWHKHEGKICRIEVTFEPYKED